MRREEALQLIDPRIVCVGPLGLRPPRHAISHGLLEGALCLFLAKVASMRMAAIGRRRGFTYASIEQMLLCEGALTRANFNDMRIGAMAERECFANAFAAASHGRYAYAEGYALMCGAAEPFHHAWLVGPDGRIEDPTWWPMYDLKRVEQPARHWSGNVVYLGVTIAADAHLRWTESRGHINLLAVRDDDIQDVLRHGAAAFQDEC